MAGLALPYLRVTRHLPFIKKKINLLDLGACPGGWSQVISEINTEGKTLSLDIKDMEPIKNVTFLKCDIFKKDTKKKIIDFFTISERG